MKPFVIPPRRQATQPPPPPLIEPLTWHVATAALPDSDSTVLLWIAADDGNGMDAGWESGWWDGQAWRLCESGGVVDGRVLFWAVPHGPAVGAGVHGQGAAQ